MAEPTLAADLPPPPEACPPPLAWQEVLEGVEQQGEAFAVDHDGIRIEGVVLGDGPPLWFLNGFAGDRRLFSLIAWLLRDRFRCVLSDAHWPDNSRPKLLQGQLAQAYDSAFNALDTARPALFGTAFGAQTALTITALKAHSESPVRGLILHEAFAHRHASFTERLLAWGGSHSNKQLSQIPNWPQLQEANHRRWFPPIDPSRWNFLLETLGQTPVHRWADMARAASSTDLTPELATLPTPVQLIRTEGDGPVATSTANELATLLPNFREETLHTSGHFAYLTHPHRVAKIVAAFLNQLPRPS